MVHQEAHCRGRAAAAEREVVLVRSPLVGVPLDAKTESRKGLENFRLGQKFLPGRLTEIRLIEVERDPILQSSPLLPTEDILWYGLYADVRCSVGRTG